MKKVDLTQGNVLKVLTLLTIPIIGSSLLQFTYNIVDMFWVGNLGSSAVASVGSSSFFVGMGFAINSLVVVGTGIKVSHALGKNNEDEVKSYTNCGIFINLVLAIVYALILMIFGKDFIGFLKLGNDIVETMANRYLFINGFVLFFTFFNMLFIRILSSYGLNSKSLKISAIGLITNIILDPIFIYTIKLKVFGAALATLVSNVIMFVIFIFQTKEIFRYDFSVGLNKEKIFEIIKLGFPMSFQRILFTLVNIVLARIISIFGAEAIAGQKVGLQIESITFMIVGGLNGAIASFVGQNYGAKKYDRIVKGYKNALFLGVIYAVFTSTMFLVFSKDLSQIFIKEPKTIEIASNYLKIVAFAQLFSAIEMISNGMFSGLGMPKIPATISVIFTSLRIPMALVFTKFMGVNGVWLSIAVSSVLKGVFAYLMYNIKVRKDEKYAL